MNQKCKVCGEPAAGFHFGAFTCEGCKSFFGRSYNNLNSITECKNNGECVINKKNRTACKACRLRKCLLVGMSKSGSRYGRRSNWFKIHCLLQEQQQQAQQQVNVRRTGKTPPPMSLAPPFPPHLFPGLAQRRPPCTKEELLLLGFDEYKKSTSPSIGSPESHNSDSSINVDDSKRMPMGHFVHKLTSPNQETPPNLPSRDVFIPLHFANLASLPSFPHSAAFLPPPSAFNALNAAHQHLLFPSAGFHPALYPHQGLLKAATNNNNNNNIRINNNNDEVNDSFTKRFYLDEVLKSQRSSPSGSSIKSTHCEEEDSEADEQSTAKSNDNGLSFARGLIVKRKSSESPIQENPMDLSVKSDSYSSKNRRKSASTAASDVNDVDMDEDDMRSNGINSRASGSEVEDEINFTEVKRLKIHRSTPLDLTTKV